MKKIKIIFGLLLLTFIFGVGLLSYMYFKVSSHLQVLEQTKPMITKIYHNISQSDPYVGAGNIANPDTLQSQIINTIKTTNPSVVNILISKNIKYLLQDPFSFRGRDKIINKQTKIGGGSGIMISKNGLIITNKHVVEDIKASYSVILSDGRIYTASQVRFDPLIDIAIIQILDENGKKPTDLVPASFGQFDANIQLGQFVLAIGNALAEYQNSCTLGIISATNRQIDANSDNLYIGLYQTDTSINPGNSGGPLVTAEGKVIGINTAISTSAEGIGFALPVNQNFIDASILSIQQHNSIKRPFLGVIYTEIDKQISTKNNLTVDKGVLVTEVVDGSSADISGIEVGDIITSINKTEISPSHPLLYNIYRFSPLEEVEITIIRSGKKQNKKVVLGSM